MTQKIQSLRALLVDDDKLALETMGMILEMDGFKVDYAQNGKQALDKLEGNESDDSSVDLMVMDLEMTQVSGLELLQEMKSRGLHVPIMVVTGFASKKTVVELMRQGVVDYLDKPIRMEEFRTRVKQMAQGILKRRKRNEASATAAFPLEPGAHSEHAARFQSPLALVKNSQPATALVDLSHLGLPHSSRSLSLSPAGKDLALACRAEHGYDILIAEAAVSDMETFYQTVLIKSFFDRHQTEGYDGPTFMKLLNQELLNGSLIRRRVSALFVRIYLAEKRLEIVNADHPPLALLQVGNPVPKSILGKGTPLGVTEEIQVECRSVSVYAGDRFFLYTEGLEKAVKAVTSFKGETGNRKKNHAASIGELIAAHAGKSLEGMVEGIWKAALALSQNKPAVDMFLWGNEIV